MISYISVPLAHGVQGNTDHFLWGCQCLRSIWIKIHEDVQEIQQKVFCSFASYRFMGCVKGVPINNFFEILLIIFIFFIVLSHFFQLYIYHLIFLFTFFWYIYILSFLHLNTPVGCLLTFPLFYNHFAFILSFHQKSNWDLRYQFFV